MIITFVTRVKTKLLRIDNDKCHIIFKTFLFKKNFHIEKIKKLSLKYKN